MGKIKNIKGETKQNGIPSPENPVEIKSKEIPCGIIKESQIQQIQWNDINRYLYRPVYDKLSERWRVIEGIKIYRGDKEIIFTDYEHWKSFEDVELYEKEGELRWME